MHVLPDLLEVRPDVGRELLSEQLELAGQVQVLAQAGLHSLRLCADAVVLARNDSSVSPSTARALLGRYSNASGDSRSWKAMMPSAATGRSIAPAILTRPSKDVDTTSPPTGGARRRTPAPHTTRPRTTEYLVFTR